MSRARYNAIAATMFVVAAMAIEGIRVSGQAGPEPTIGFERTSLGALAVCLLGQLVFGLRAYGYWIRERIPVVDLHDDREGWVFLDPNRETFPRKVTGFIDL